jgi:hypothetical protein
MAASIDIQALIIMLRQRSAPAMLIGIWISPPILQCITGSGPQNINGIADNKNGIANNERLRTVLSLNFDRTRIEIINKKKRKNPIQAC